MTRVLLISCSGLKRKSMIPLKAVDLYAGKFFLIITAAKRERRWPADVHVGIISAQHGFLEGDTIIEPYNTRLTRRTLQLLQPTITERLNAFLSRLEPTETMIAMSHRYQEALANSEVLQRLQVDGKVKIAEGGIGQQQRIVLNWLNETALPIRPQFAIQRSIW